MTGNHQGNGGQEQPHQVWNASQPLVGSGADQDVKPVSLFPNLENHINSAFGLPYLGLTLILIME